MIYQAPISSRFVLTLLLLLGSFCCLFAAEGDFPAKPNPPRLVNDLAGTMAAGEVEELERKLQDYAVTSSTQITIVTIRNLGGYEVAQYAVELANKWGIGQSGKNNGVLLLASVDDHKINISTGYGLEGALTDAMSGRIIRNEIAPAFRQNKFYQGFSKGADAIILATKGEYKADPQQAKGRGGFSTAGIVILIMVIY
ncbi:MAG: TPM domain-containing protein, partial [Sphingobacteriales bacterium]